MLLSTLPTLIGYTDLYHYTQKTKGVVSLEFFNYDESVLIRLENQAEKLGANAIINIQIIRTGGSVSVILGTAILVNEVGSSK